MASLKEMFAECEDAFLEFDEVKSRLSDRADLHAFIMLDRLQPGSQDMITASEHDEFWLSIDCDKLAEVVTPEQVRDLTRCGIRYSEEQNCLCMFA
jgi:hypothetical protein